MDSFALDIPERALADLRDRLKRTRFPPEETVSDWSQGVPSSYARELRRYWLEDYEWRVVEAALNDLGQFTTVIDGLVIHLLHVRSSIAGARPLLLTHGWPGSVIEFLDLVEPLTDPTRHGGDAGDAFHVVVPSLPGFGFGSTPREPGWTTERIADAWVTLMRQLDYQDWIAHGGDWGSLISSLIAVRHPNEVAGIHLTMPVARPTTRELTTEEHRAKIRRDEHLSWGSGYSLQQATRPQTLGYALADSPMGQAAWIVEKFHAWSDHEGDYEQVISRNRVIDNVMVYWLGNTGASSARLYWESFRNPNLDPVAVPTACSVFPKEIFTVSKRFVEARYRNLCMYRRHPRGGHFAAMEQPAALVTDLREFSQMI